MRNNILIILILIVCSCKAQTIVPLYGGQEILADNSGHYYKDVDGNLNKFVGTWQWSHLNNSITISLKKEENIDSSDGYTHDLLVGEYKYVKQGAEIVNTLSKMNDNNVNGRDHNISGLLIISKYVLPKCDECAEIERRVKLHIDHPADSYVSGWLTLRNYTENGVEKLKMIVQDKQNLSDAPNAPDRIDIPEGEYILVKQ